MVRCLGCMEEYDGGDGVCPHCGYVTGTQPKKSYYLMPETVLHGKYLAGRVLGYGGFGVTYIGWDLELNRKVAIKEYLPSDFATREHGSKSVTVFSENTVEQFQSGLESFIAEARKLAKFDNIPEIVGIYDCFMENNTGYIVMEFLYGQTVKELLKNGKSFPYQTALQIIRPILIGLGKVHQEGIIHRDVAPDNIFITEDNQVRLFNFRTAHYVDYVLLKRVDTDVLFLRPGYVPEEQYRRNGEQGPWTDVYAAAATLYRMITGICPQDSIERLIDDQVRTPSELGIDIPASVENALMNALNIKREYRPQTAKEFLEALDSDHVDRIVPRKTNEERVKMSVWGKLLMAGTRFFRRSWERERL